MTATVQDFRSASRQQRWIEVKNIESSAQLPAFAPAQIVDAERADSDERTILHLKLAQSDNPSPALMVAIGPMDIEAGKYGPATASFPAYMRYTGTAPSNGDVWGVASGANQLSTGKRGFIVCGDASGGLVRVRTDYIGKKPLVRFTLDSALATSDASKAATITDQYGQGVDGATSITVHNLLTSTASTYVFEGASGAAGLAFWDSGTNYRVLNMQCPT